MLSDPFQNQRKHSTDETCLRIEATVSVGLSVGGWQQSDKRDDEERDEMNGEVEEIRSNAHSAHET